MFSCLCDVAISFFKNCNELVDPVSLKSIGFMEKIEEKNPKIFKFSYGKKQIFAAGEAKFDLNREFNENNETSEYSLVIKLETEDILEKEAIFTYCSINSTGPGGISPDPHSQIPQRDRDRIQTGFLSPRFAARKYCKRDAPPH